MRRLLEQNCDSIKSTTGFYHSTCRIYWHGRAKAQFVHITSFTAAEWKFVNLVRTRFDVK